MPIYLRGETYWAAISLPGRGRVRRSLATDNKREAQRRYDTLKAELWQEPQARPAGRTFGQALVEWLNFRERGQSDVYNVSYLRDRIPSLTALDEITPALFLDRFADKSPGTYNRIQATLRSVLNHARERDWIQTVPRFKRRAEPPPVDRHIDGEAWGRLRAELPKHLIDLAEFSLATGLRRANATGLLWSQVNMKARYVALDAGKTKAKRAIHVPLNDLAMAVLKRRAGVHDVYVFTYNGRPFRDPKTAFIAARERAGLDGFRWHDIRHTWASWHAMNGTPESVLQQLGGWKTDMHKRYSHLSPQYIAQFAGNAKPLEPAKKRRRA